jgi:syntaxin 16
VDEIHFEITKVKNKLKELSTLHDKHLNRPTLDDNQDEENTINLLTQEITQVSKTILEFKKKPNKNIKFIL